MTHHYTRTPLFGGALECALPDNFADVSKLRQVPDNQEVFIDKDGFTSIIFDITERVGGPGSSPEIDGQALTTHLEELVGTDDDTVVKMWNTAETEFSKVEYVGPFAHSQRPFWSLGLWLTVCSPMVQQQTPSLHSHRYTDPQARKR